MSRLFRMATEADAQALLAIYAPYTRGTASFEDGPPALEEFAARIRDISAVYPYIVCEVDGEIAGYAYAHLYKERAAYRWNVEVTIYLSPAFHRRGIGRALMQRLLEMLRRQGVRMAYSCITCPTPPAPACTRPWALPRPACSRTRAGKTASGATSSGCRSA